MGDYSIAGLTKDEYDALLEFLNAYQAEKSKQEEREKVVKNFMNAFQIFTNAGGQIALTGSSYQTGSILTKQDFKFTIAGIETEYVERE